MGKHTAALVRKSLEMAMLELKIAIELVGAASVGDAVDHIDEAEELTQRAKELLK